MRARGASPAPLAPPAPPSRRQAHLPCMRRTRSRGRAEEDAALAAAEARFAARLAAAAPRRERAAVAERRAAVRGAVYGMEGFEG